MKTIVNFRSFVIIALITAAAVFTGRLVFSYTAIGVIILTSIVSGCLITGIILRKKNIAAYKQVTFFTAAVTSVIAVAGFLIVATNWIPKGLEDGNHDIKASIEKNYVVDGKNYVVIKNLNIDGSNVCGKMLVRVNNDKVNFYNTPIGYKVSFSGYVKVKNVLGENSEYNFSSFSSNIRYITTVEAGDISVKYGNADLMDIIYRFVCGQLVDNLGAENGYVAYGMLSGDRYAISESIADTFSIAGVAHILAVSGLHIGFLTSLLFFLLKTLKVRKIPSFAITALVLFLYAIFAGFSPSVLRACFMCLVASAAILVGEEKDLLNSLGFAVTAILIVAPQMLFTAGMIMSTCAVFGLAVFAKPISLFLHEKLKLPKFISESLSASFGAQLGVMPVTIYYFGTIQTYSVVTNVLLMPIISTAFIAVFISVILSILPFMGFTIKVSGFFVNILVKVSAAMASLKYASITAKAGEYIFLVYPIYFVCGGYVNVKYKRLVYFISWICMAILMILCVII